MNLAEAKKLNIPKSPGVYQFFDKAGRLIYIGKAAKLSNRILSYWQKSVTHTPAKKSMVSQAEKIKWVETGSEIEALLLEANLIKKYQPPYNIVMRDDKRYVYIKVSTDDPIPGVFLVRKTEKAGRYFGPFTSTTAVKETLKALRKVWPYCLARRPQAKPCFYQQINLCLGVCAGLVSRREYLKKVIGPIILFFQGKKNKVVKNYELRIKNYEARLRKEKTGSEKYRIIEEKVNELKHELQNMKKVLEHANVVSLAEKYASDVAELAKILGLSKAPERIEGYDIANLFGREAVGVLAVFRNGEPDKNEYRKFKIKVGQGEANDVRMLKEILERRFNNDWPLPDLIIIDGGKAQLNVGAMVLKKAGLKIPLAAISKGGGLRSAAARDKIFFPGEKTPLELPLASPALHLIKRVRDEAHRFAIGYHKVLRKRKFLSGG